MKVFAIITAALMASAGVGYYVYNCDSCESNRNCPLAKSGGCCLHDAPQSCESPCSHCNTDCFECCDICESCCTYGVQVSHCANVSAASPVEDDGDCPHCRTPINVATSAVTAGVTLK
jgi:hypothetical protein